MPVCRRSLLSTRLTLKRQKEIPSRSDEDHHFLWKEKNGQLNESLIRSSRPAFICPFSFHYRKWDLTSGSWYRASRGVTIPGFIVFLVINQPLRATRKDDSPGDWRRCSTFSQRMRFCPPAKGCHLVKTMAFKGLKAGHHCFQRWSGQAELAFSREKEARKRSDLRASPIDFLFSFSSWA